MVDVESKEDNKSGNINFSIINDKLDENSENEEEEE
jgi:hypothetical protein